jgi:hypothetical protein
MCVAPPERWLMSRRWFAYRTQVAEDLTPDVELGFIAGPPVGHQRVILASVLVKSNLLLIICLSRV